MKPELRAHIDEMRKHKQNWALGEDEGLLLYALTKRLKPQIFFEVGTRFGISSCYIIQGLLENGFGKLITCDVEDFGTGEKFKELGVGEYVEYYQGDSHRARDYNIDLAFIDGAHDLESVEIDVRNITDKSQPLLIFHDVAFVLEINTFLGSMMRNKIYLRTTNGVTLCAKC
jgi:predicted O-methyltransferase YrrM